MTSFLIYRQDLAVARREGSAQTTGPQRVRGLEKAGRVRCKRTVQRQRRRLERMGLMRYGHIKRKGAKEGERDSLRVTPTWGNVTLPRGQHRQGLRPYLSVLEQPEIDRENCGRDLPTLPEAAVPSAGDELRKPASGTGRDEKRLGTEGRGASPPELVPGPEAPLTSWGAQMMLQLGLG